MDLAKFCRLCGKNTGSNDHSIFEKNENGEQLIQIIKKCIPVIVYRTDPLSKLVCEECCGNLDIYYKFLNQCIKVQDYFKDELFKMQDDTNIQLYLNTVESHKFDFLTSFQITYDDFKDMNCHISEEIKSDSVPEFNNKKRPFSCIKIRTPETINEINLDSRYCVTSTTDDGAPVKKRKLAGPRSKTRQDIVQNPSTLMQCALQKVNEHIFDGTSHNLFIKMEDDVNQLFNESLHLFDSTDEMSFDVNAPVFCNYCMKGFLNSVDLSKHEVGHIKVDVGPKLEKKEFAVKYKKYYSYYLDYRQRMISESEDADMLEDKTDDEDNDTNLLVPVASSSNTATEHIFEVINNEITVNGIPLKNIDKQERRSMYKTIIVDGIRKKFCTICRHTFKDNWAIDIHYVNSSCQYTCKYCGMKFKFHKELFPEHLKTHEGEPCNKIFGPSDKRSKMRKRRVLKLNRFTNHALKDIPKIKPIKMKHLFEKNQVIKQEDDTAGSSPDKSDNIQPYQAYFCRKCFKVFFKIAEFNCHTQICKGTGSSEGDAMQDTSIHSEQSKSSESSENTTHMKRPVRSCVKDFSHLHDSDSESTGSWASSKATFDKEMPSSSGGFECVICCSSFPSIPSRNSHMRIHKGQKVPIDKLHRLSTPKVVKDARDEAAQIGNVKLAALNPTVAKLVQNNPHLTIRKYSLPNATPQTPELPSVEPEEQQSVRAYRCTDCNNKFQNKSLLYYHKLQTCIVKKFFECAFCKKRFGTQEQYNTHMVYVHPE